MTMEQMEERINELEHRMSLIESRLVPIARLSRIEPEVLANQLYPLLKSNISYNARFGKEIKALAIRSVKGESIYTKEDLGNLDDVKELLDETDLKDVFDSIPK